MEEAEEQERLEKEEALGGLVLKNFRNLLVNVSFIAFRSMSTLMSVYCCAESAWPCFVSEDPLIISNGFSPGASFLLSRFNYVLRYKTIIYIY